jgi:hypothetical protein
MYNPLTSQAEGSKFLLYAVLLRLHTSRSWAGVAHRTLTLTKKNDGKDVIRSGSVMICM